MENDSFVLLTTAANETESAMIREILNEHGIESYAKTRGMGSCYAISSLLSVDIYVVESRLELAEMLLSAFTEASDSPGRIYLTILAKKPIKRLKRA